MKYEVARAVVSSGEEPHNTELMKLAGTFRDSMNVSLVGVMLGIWRGFWIF